MKTAVIAILFFTVSLNNVLAEEHASLDGKVFSGELNKAGDSKSDKDTLTFKGGKFLSAACVAYGFREAPYTVSEKDGVTTFTATATNDKGESMAWTGTIKGGAVEATAVNTSPSGATSYTFKGKAGAMKVKGDEHPKGEHPEHPKP
ncbi:MAG TPA: hypothetical protein VFV19_18260 [Candidatus Polarisedimenticolaceae bacterium]|nr:hypothetical protein [Candidatus Polarisedimenticolaceae bacterium]